MIRAEILADSLNPNKDRLTTFKVTFPRYILAEFNTHRAFSRNSASSRAIPFKKMVQMVEDNPFIPMAWQKDHKGMQGTEYITEPYDIEAAKETWLEARDEAIKHAKRLNSGNLITKQLCNRLLEPFMWHTVIVTTSKAGLQNFFKLRCPQYSLPEEIEPFQYKFKSLYAMDDFYEDHPLSEEIPETYLGALKINNGMADIHIMDLAEKMYDVYNGSTPKQLKAGEWHIPFGDKRGEDFADLVMDLGYLSSGGNDDEAINLLMRKIAIARCARISYQTYGENPKIDYSADIKLFDRLLKSQHLSPFEHVAEAKNDSNMYANFQGFEQMRTKLESE